MTNAKRKSYLKMRIVNVAKPRKIRRKCENDKNMLIMCVWTPYLSLANESKR